MVDTLRTSTPRRPKTSVPALSLHEVAELTSRPLTQVKKPVEVQLDGPSMRRIIASGLATAAAGPKPAIVSAPVFCAQPALLTPATQQANTALRHAAFDSILDDYLPPSQRSNARSTSSASPVPPPPAANQNAFDAILGL